jgi:hypothetical protein
MLELSGRYTPIRQVILSTYFQATTVNEMTSSKVGQRPEPLNTPQREIEQLLDIEGLLKIERLIRNIKKEGRLESASNEQIRHGRISQMNRPED